MHKSIQQKFLTEDSPYLLEFRNPQQNISNQLHDFHKIVAVYSGSGTYTTPNDKIKISADDILIIKPNQLHAYEDTDNLILMNIFIRQSFFSDISSELSSAPTYSELFCQHEKNNMQQTHRIKLNKLQLFEIRAIIDSMGNEIESQRTSWKIMNTSYLIQLLILLIRIYNDSNYPDADKNNKSYALVKHIEKNYAKNFTMQDLVDFSNMSESTILRKVKKITGFSPFEFQIRHRLLVAASLLATTKKDITHIAYDVGFNDSNYFSRCFKKFIGVSPRKYREELSDKQL